MNDEGIGFCLNFIGTLVAISGLICNAIGMYKESYILWMVADIALIVLFWGVHRKWWNLNGGAIVQVVLYSVYLALTVVGMARVM